MDEHKGESQHYDTEGNGPDLLLVYKGIRSGDRVKYVGPMPLEGVFVVDEILQFTAQDILAVMRPEGSVNDIYEVNADNLEKM